MKKPLKTKKQRSLGKRKKASAAKRVKDPSARDALLRAAKHWFARKGLSGTSIRDIASEAGVNSSLISYYFESKEGLYRACLQEIGDRRLAMAEEILKPPETYEELRFRSQMLVENLLSLYLEDLDAGLILAREYDRAHSPAEDVFRSTYLKIFEKVISFIKSAQKKGLMDKSKDPFLLASLLFGGLTSHMRTDHLMEKAFGRTLKNKNERQKLLDHTVELFFARS
ncbi:MAG: TetR family transcriptional regulator [Bdellovibrionales bacterium]|nr:TetR family transcriptional regulator [Bdellovibrionales bacterium]